MLCGIGTGVNDSIVNQLLAKIDGVDSLNNILLIGIGRPFPAPVGCRHLFIDCTRRHDQPTGYD